ncbi:(2Fe-2S)-binding protein [Gymnodinialimonas ceratoperidinii]|uniref:(2Fe-2S)-binding protein n=1 Tax=Gymnodinialimonas ceratoperidinii TaxID=2856823 RepID=A0A8F6YEC6_9RHOB|nr:(2Fe-2S)-binding protein [Gymnodinialimonas ceratoperidinii]QXT41077.1 (2Fe-2S)-binding protein [Gymnodinialimonas ceratoperidinii]
MSDTANISVTVNGETTAAAVPVRQNLVDFLRNTLGLTGSHVGCEHGVCGACTLEVDGAMVRGCLMLAVQADGAQITTVEGYGDRAEALRAAFVEHNALQCGYCTPGMMASALEYVEAGGQADRAAIREHLSGNYCRCTGYQSIVDAVCDVIEGESA